MYLCIYMFLYLCIHLNMLVRIIMCIINLNGFGQSKLILNSSKSKIPVTHSRVWVYIYIYIYIYIIKYSVSSIFCLMYSYQIWWGYPRGVMVKAMDYGIVVSNFVFQSHCHVHFWANTLGKGMNSLILPAMDLIVPLLFFLENGFGIK